jgi:hypothetical protein
MTLDEIKARRPCEEGWKKLRKSVGTCKPLSTVVTLEQILESNGVRYAQWALQCVGGHDREIRLYAVQCACMVRHLMHDPRSIRALETAALYAEGLEDGATLEAAGSAARAAAWAAAWDAEAAAWAAAGAAACAAAWAAAWDSSWDAAWAAAWDAAGAAEAAACDAAWAAALKRQAEEMGRMIRGEGVYDRSWADNL